MSAESEDLVGAKRVIVEIGNTVVEVWSAGQFVTVAAQLVITISLVE